ncbi:hypothetical protein HDV02_004007 [Globomyces sp. JEL0801]|nr:hypothetical protein HDV02_004007 [Globomyces sp. JEL0801]
MILPSSTLRSQFIRTLELGTRFEDPKNKYIYKVVEKRLSSNSFAKVAVNDVNSQPDAPPPIKLENVPENMFKSENVNKANINKSMKNKILTLEEKLKKLMNNQSKSLYRRIKELLDDNCYETDNTIYILHSGLILLFKREYYPTLEDAKDNLEKMLWRSSTQFRRNFTT